MERERCESADVFHAEIDPAKQFLSLSFAAHVDEQQMKDCLEKVMGLLGELQPGFRMFTDLSSLDSMSVSCAPRLGEMMSRCDARGVSAIIRVVPDPGKDIGFALLSHFHYGKHVKLQTYQTLAEAAHALAVEIPDGASDSLPV
jgi:hypothetical protein